VFANGSLAEADNAVLASVLLAPQPGTRVVYLDPWAPGAQRSNGEPQSWSDLVAPSLKIAAWQVLIAFIVFAVAKSIRHGKPVVEMLPVALAGSRSVVAAGNLLHTSRQHQQAGQVLQSQALAAIRNTLGLPTEASVEVVAQGLANRLGLPVAQIMGLFTRPVLADDELVVLARQIDEVQHALRRVSSQVHQEA
jgi:hypothetical protein